MTQFTQGDTVRNINPASKYHGMVGTFQRQFEWIFCSGPACDVLVEGMQGTYGYPFVIQSIADLELVEGKQSLADGQVL